MTSSPLPPSLPPSLSDSIYLSTSLPPAMAEVAEVSALTRWEFSFPQDSVISLSLSFSFNFNALHWHHSQTILAEYQKPLTPIPSLSLCPSPSSMNIFNFQLLKFQFWVSMSLPGIRAAYLYPLTATLWPFLTSSRNSSWGLCGPLPLLSVSFFT